MKNSLSLITYIILISLLGNCNQIEPKEIREYGSRSNVNYYISYKEEFDSDFVNHFPQQVKSDYFVSSNTDTNKNNVGLILYKYECELRDFEITKELVKKNNILATYNADDSCLLIVNRFETNYTLENNKTPNIEDSSLINRDCYNDKFPIPNFLEYDSKRDRIIGGLDKSFTLYVFDAFAGHFYKQFKMKPFIQMPHKWKNGYSKGIAVSEKNRTIIYWVVFW